MAVDDSDVVDFVGTTRDSSEVVLTIADHLTWDEPQEHLVLLQSKINTYLTFIESGQLAEEYPNAKVIMQVRIDVACKYSPSSDGERFLTQAGKIIEEAGWRFSWSSPRTRDTNADLDSTPIHIALPAPLVPLTNSGPAMVAALSEIANAGGPSGIGDPVEWQREVRADRALPGRNEKEPD